MPIKYACFISYVHGQHELMRTFVEELKRALESSLEAWLEEDVYIDDGRLEPGFHYNEALARALCESLCMIVVYTPRYQRSSYCLREYAGMRELEQRRRAAIGAGLASERGMIIPIIFRGRSDDLPDEISGEIQYVDFSRFTTADGSITRNREYVKAIEKVARYIYDMYETCKHSADAAFGNCDAFTLPAEEDVTPWKARQQVFPGRESR
jgi:hypothetical protein